jgi:hypothetical protein
MQNEKRRALFEAVVAKYERLGLRFESDPGFRASVEEWIAGTIETDELQQRYRALTDMRRNVRSLMRSSRMIHTAAPTEVEPDPSEQSAGLPSPVVRRPSADLIACEPAPASLTECGFPKKWLLRPRRRLAIRRPANHRTGHHAVF